MSSEISGNVIQSVPAPERGKIRFCIDRKRRGISRRIERDLEQLIILASGREVPHTDILRIDGSSVTAEQIRDQDAIPWQSFIYIGIPHIVDELHSFFGEEGGHGAGLCRIERHEILGYQTQNCKHADSENSDSDNHFYEGKSQLLTHKISIIV